MMRLRNLLAGLIVFSILTAHSAAGPIQWVNDPEAAVRAARQRMLPIYFYVPASRDQEREAENWEDAQKRTHRDARVEAVVNARFIPLRLQRGTQNDWFFQKVGVTNKVGRHGGVASPDLDLLERLTAPELLRATTLLRQLTSGFRKFRDQLYEKQLEPVIQEESAKPEKLNVALGYIRDYLITSADKDVIALLDRELSNATRVRVYETLAALSTRKCAAALLAHAAADPLAVRAMARCEPGAAPIIAAAMNSDYDELHVAAYNALCDILNLKSAKPESFWKTGRADEKAAEVRRVADLATERERAWKRDIEPYR